MATLDLAQTIADLLKEKEYHEQIAALEIAARLLFDHYHVELVLKAV